MNRFLLETVMWWLITAWFVLAALYRLQQTCEITKRAQLDPTVDIPVDVPMSMFVVPFLMIYFSVVWKRVLLPQAAIGGCIWIFMYACVIIQEKAVSRESWKAYMDKRLDEFLCLFEMTRHFLLRTSAYWMSIPSRVRSGAALTASILVSAFAVVFSHNPVLPVLLYLVGVLFFCIVWAGKSLHSCRKLLLFLFVHCMIFAAISGLSLAVIVGPANIVAGYVGFTLITGILWLLIVGAADDAPVKLCCQIVNTLTTILLVVSNVLSIWGGSNLPIPGLPFFWSEVQYCSTALLLPIVVSGYLAGLLKEIQAYRKACLNRVDAEEEAE